MKKAILVVSFGTSYEETRKKTIDIIEKKIAEGFPEYTVYRAWTSKIIIKKLKERDNIHIYTVKEAIEKMMADGVTDLVIQPTHIINGIENDNMRRDAHILKKYFNSVKVGSPLLTSEEDNLTVVRAVGEEFSSLTERQALVLMGHGTEHYANSIYAALDYRFKIEGYKNIFMGTVEGYPALEQVKKLVKEYNPEEVVLAPFMFVAGDHATNDMAGEEDDSWANEFRMEGYNVKTVLKGLGEYDKIQDLYMKHIREAIEK